MKYWIMTGIVGIAALGIFLSHTGVTVYAPELSSDQPVTKPLLFTGDIMLGRYVETLASKYKDTSFPFASTTEFLRSHITISNLEGPIPFVHVPTPINGFTFSFPPYVPEVLKENGIVAVTLANNHMFDQGRNGWIETKDALDIAGIKHFGGYAPTEGDYFQTSLGNKPVIVYGITMIATGFNEQQALEVTRTIVNDHPDAQVVAFIHWGNEYDTQNATQQEFAHKLISLGVDAIIGSHPHVVQGVEIYQGKPIFYSLGNFIFDQYFTNDVEDGYLVEVSSTDRQDMFTLIPIRSSHSVPRFAEEETKSRILQSISSQSDLSLQKMILEGKILLNQE